MPLEPNESAEHFRVVDSAGFSVPFTLKKEALEFYVAKPSLVRVLSPDRERVLALTLPALGEFRWKPPAETSKTIFPAGHGSSAVDLWKWLAFAGALGLGFEWFFFGQRSMRRRSTPASAAAKPRKKQEELVHQ